MIPSKPADPAEIRSRVAAGPLKLLIWFRIQGNPIFKVGRPRRSGHLGSMHLTIAPALFAAFILLASPTTLMRSAAAQYSSDPATPLVLLATKSDDVQPKLAPAPEGGHFVSMLSGSGYDVVLSRLNADGSAAWTSQPRLVEDRALSSTTDYGLASDAAGNAYVAFDALNGTTPAIKLVCFSADGSVRWRAVVAESASAYLAVARVTVASDGAVWVVHIQDSSSRVQRFDPATGVASFATSVSLAETGATQFSADIQPSVDGAVIVSCVRYVTFSGAKILRAHRVNADGTRPWATTGTSVFTTGSLQFGNFPSFISDGSGGAYFSWYTSSPLQCSVQRVNAAGAVQYGASGIAVTTTTTSASRVSPSITLGADGRLYAFWSQNTPNTSIYGVFGQCFAKGVRQWGANGVAVEPLATVYSRSFATAARTGDGVACFFTDSSSAVQDKLECVGLSSAGVELWHSDVATNVGVKYRLSSMQAADNGAMITWQGGTSTGASDVFAARIGADGVVGPSAESVFGDLDGDGIVSAPDLSIILSTWGAAGGAADLDGDGTVGAADLALLLGAWSAM